MVTFKKPRLGLLGLITDGYEPIFPGILSRQAKYAKEIVDSVSDVADLYFESPAINRKSIEDTVKRYNDMELDGIVIVLLAYSQGSWLIRALQNNNLPLALAIIQPEQIVKDDWEELDLTVNQGIHGAQDNSNAIIRAGFKCQFFAGNRNEPLFKNFILDFGKAASTFKHLKQMRVAIIGKMSGMNDILGDEMSFYKKIGPECAHETIGTVYRYMQSVTKNEIDERIEKDRTIFNIDSKLSYDSHAYAVKMYLGFKKFLEDKNYDAFTAHFEVFSEDGRFKQLPLMAASHLMADGYGYAAEGDGICAAMVSAAHRLGNRDANFTEMYTMDFEKKAILFCHAGEGNWATCRKDMKPRLIDRYLGEGGLENPPTPVFTPQYGKGTLTSFVSVCGDKFRVVSALGEILPKSDLTRCEMPYFFWSPKTGIEKCVKNWVKNAGTHHEIINLGDISERWKMLADMLDIEFVEV
jgi:L-arabinose isomerase